MCLSPCLPTDLFSYLPVSLHIYPSLSIYLSYLPNLSIHRCIHLNYRSTYLFIYLPTYLPTYLSIYLSIYLFYLSTYLPIYLSIYLSIGLSLNYPSIHLYMLVNLSIYLPKLSIYPNDLYYSFIRIIHLMHPFHLICLVSSNRSIGPSIYLFNELIIMFSTLSSLFTLSILSIAY